ncbi:MAG: RNA polymerase sigma factor FliA [Epsilonproteobacteria bacterium]|nr:RNA polymerase sigma factor FliA [Campylobacterota bacterium]
MGTETIEKGKYAETNDVVIQFLPAVRAMSFRLKERLPSSIDVNDLIAIGVEEMVKLSRRYDVEQNDSFWGYAKKRVYGSMLDYLRSLDVVSRNNRRLIKAIELETSKHLTEHSREPSESFLAEKLGESVAKIREAKAAAEIANNVPLNEQIMANPNESVEEKVEQDQLIEAVKSILTTLSDREQTIIQLYYFEELNLKEISEILEISESRISQLHKKLMKQIREKLVQ